MSLKIELRFLWTHHFIHYRHLKLMSRTLTPHLDKDRSRAFTDLPGFGSVRRGPTTPVELQSFSIQTIQLCIYYRQRIGRKETTGAADLSTALIVVSLKNWTHRTLVTVIRYGLEIALRPIIYVPRLEIIQHKHQKRRQIFWINDYSSAPETVVQTLSEQTMHK